ncbi:MAG: prepilin-type N-terminal cleavage/methylation domain-containing protein [Phycisphaerae bacterium]|nr:prepilin-type N-terminal cleavage/methylation domain-containing protein [Phycisphaerae bacterium]
MRRVAHTRAFSLLELAIVVMIISLLATIAVPRYANAIAQQRVEAAARRIALDLEGARRRARATSSSQAVQFSLANSSYTLAGVSDMDQADSTYTVEMSKPPYEATIITANFADSTEITFDGYGTPLDGAGGSVVVQVGTRAKTITVDGETGQVTIQ